MIAFGPHTVFRNILQGSNNVLQNRNQTAFNCPCPVLFAADCVCTYMLYFRDLPPIPCFCGLPRSHRHWQWCCLLFQPWLQPLSPSFSDHSSFLSASSELWAPPHLSTTHRLYSIAASVSSPCIAFSSLHTPVWPVYPSGLTLKAAAWGKPSLTPSFSYPGHMCPCTPSRSWHVSHLYQLLGCQSKIHIYSTFTLSEPGRYLTMNGDLQLMIRLAITGILELMKPSKYWLVKTVVCCPPLSLEFKGHKGRAVAFLFPLHPRPCRRWQACKGCSETTCGLNEGTGEWSRTLFCRSWVCLSMF